MMNDGIKIIDEHFVFRKEMVEVFGEILLSSSKFFSNPGDTPLVFLSRPLMSPV